MSNQKKVNLTEDVILAIPPIEAEPKLDNQPSSEFVLLKSDFFDLEQRYAALKDSEERYRRLFETAKDGILILDGDTGRIVDANPFIQDLLGYPESELIGKALWEIGPVQEIPDSQKAMRELQMNEYIRYEDIPLETKAGVRKHVEFVSNVYLVDGWRVIQCNIRDITERKQAETKALTANDELVTMVNELQWRDKQMQIMNHMNELLQSCITQEEAYRIITLCAADLFPGHNGSLAILPGRNENLDVVAWWGTEQIMEPFFLWMIVGGFASVKSTR